jgi:hypothetical protein
MAEHGEEGIEMAEHGEEGIEMAEQGMADLNFVVLLKNEGPEE